MKKLDQFKDKLTGEYLETFENAELYYKLSSLDDVKGCINEIADLLLNAQENEWPVIKAVGNDIRKFCDNLKKAYFPYFHVQKVIEKLFGSSIFTLVYGLIYKREQLATIFFIILTGILISDIFSYFFRKFIFKRNIRLSTKKVKYVSIIHKLIFYALIILLIVIFPKIPLEITLYQVFVLCCIITVIGIVTHLSLNLDFRKEIKSINKDSKIQSEKKLIETLEKRLVKENKKREKKGQLPINYRELAIQIKEEHKLVRIPLFILFIFYLSIFIYIVWYQLIYGFAILSMTLSVILLILLIFFILIIGGSKDYYIMLNKLENRHYTFDNDIENNCDINLYEN